MVLQRIVACLVALFVVAAFPFASAQELVCYRGPIMDTYCIELGFLLDNPDEDTLNRPELHSLHCLVDVSRCRADGYEFLAESTDENAEYPWQRFLRFDQAGNEAVIDLARSTGDPSGCYTCNGTMGNERTNFRATAVGTVLAESGTPPIFALHNMTTFDQACPEGIPLISPGNLGGVTPEPTLSYKPSEAPSALPTVAPSGQPSTSASPSKSAAPSPAPSVSDDPTLSPAPSANPSASNVPSMLPSWIPSGQPSQSASPTDSSVPSGSPSTSTSPSVSGTPS